MRYKRHVKNIYVIVNHSRTTDVSVEMTLLNGEESDVDATAADDWVLKSPYELSRREMMERLEQRA